MRSIRFLALVAFAALIGAASLSGIRADEWNKSTKVVVNEPVQVPGTVLEPGTYTFRLMDSPSDRHIVQVFNADGTRLITTVLAINNYQLEPSGHTILAFEERPIGEPVALKAWFYPGDNFGQEFVYPKQMATALSQVNETEVPAASPEQPAPAATTQPAETTPPQPVTEPQPAPQQEPAQATPQSTEPQPAPELPKTASDEPLIGLAGLLALGGALALRLFGRQPS
jgi:hypothetical protein